MNEKFNKNAKVEKFTNMLGIAVSLIVIDPFIVTLSQSIQLSIDIKLIITKSMKYFDYYWYVG